LEREAWYLFLAAAALVGVYVYVCIFWCLFAYNRRRRPAAASFTGNPPIEIAYVAIPLALVIWLFAVTLRAEVPMDRVARNPDGIVGVAAFRWSWRFAYAEGRIVTVGTPFAPPTLYLPVNRTTEIDLTTDDVNHSFWVPAFLFKRDAIPGMTNRFDITPTRTGTFLGRCAQFCGLEHALMTFRVRVVSASAFDAFVKTNGQATP
jgi:cytochrome c oxidase subunit 2